MSCPTYTDFTIQRRAAWDRYRIHAYRQHQHLREVGPEAAAMIATEASRQRHELSQRMFEHQTQCGVCKADTSWRGNPSGI